MSGDNVNFCMKVFLELLFRHFLVYLSVPSYLEDLYHFFLRLEDANLYLPVFLIFLWCLQLFVYVDQTFISMRQFVRKSAV